MSEGEGGSKGVDIPGIGKVNKTWLMAGGGAFFLVLGYAYYKNHKASQAASAALSTANSASQYSDTGGSPDYGTNYGGEYYAGYGGTDPNTGVPYAYENYQDYGQSSSTSTVSNNEEWTTEAIQDAQGLGATYTVAQDAVELYLAQSPSGLPSNEYTLMQSVVAELGPPPQGGPYRLIQASTGTTGTGGGNPPGSGGTKAIAAGEQIIVPVDVVPPNSVQKVANQYGISLGHILQANPGKTSTSTGVIQVPYQIQAGDTLDKLASKFGIAPEHMAQILSSQGIV